MKLIEKVKCGDCIWYYYENGIIKRVWEDGEICWLKNYCASKDDGPVVENCIGCSENKCLRKGGNNKYKRHFYLNKNGNINGNIDAKEFAEKTKHKICNYCGDFCKQECFL